MNSRTHLALDFGAESGRAILGTLANGKLQLAEAHRFANTPIVLPNGLYWNTLGLFQQICESIRVATSQVDSLQGIAVDTWGVDFGLLDEHGALLENPRHYRDERTRGLPEELFKTVPREDVFRLTGIQVMELNSLYQLYAIHRTSPWLLERAAKLLFMPDLMHYFLTGLQRSERTIASTSQFYDASTRQFATGLLQRLGIPTRFLADLVDPGVYLGPVLQRIAEACSLRQELRVYSTGGHDTASAVAAVPAHEGTNWCYISSGTWSLMGVELDEPLIHDASLAANFTNEAGVGNRVRFLKNLAGLWLLQECRRAWEKQGSVYTYAELMELAAAAQPLDTIIDPDAFYSPGNHPERIRQHCRDTGQPVPETPGETCRVILYSLAIGYKNVLENLRRMTGRRIDVIHIVGGGSRNRLLNQLAADVCQCRVVAGPVEATAAGNILTQLLGTGGLSSLEELRQVVRNSFEVEEFLPSDKQHRQRRP
jgi:rhamnulokinase